MLQLKPRPKSCAEQWMSLQCLMPWPPPPPGVHETYSKLTFSLPHKQHITISLIVLKFCIIGLFSLRVQSGLKTGFVHVRSNFISQMYMYVATSYHRQFIMHYRHKIRSFPLDNLRYISCKSAWWSHHEVITKSLWSHHDWTWGHHDDIIMMTLWL